MILIKCEEGDLLEFLTSPATTPTAVILSSVVVVVVLFLLNIFPLPPPTSLGGRPIYWNCVTTRTAKCENQTCIECNLRARSTKLFHLNSESFAMETATNSFIQTDRRCPLCCATCVSVCVCLCVSLCKSTTRPTTVCSSLRVKLSSNRITCALITLLVSRQVIGAAKHGAI